MDKIYPVIAPAIACLVFALTASANAATTLSDSFWLLGNFTQNVPCKGDGSDPVEVKVTVSTTQIDSKLGICTFLDAKEDGKTLKAQVDCQLPSGPYMGEIVFTQKSANVIDFADSNKAYTSVLYRCPK
jgi:hypothetical protein